MEIFDLNANLQEQGVKLSTSAKGSQPSGNTKQYKIQRPPSSTQKNKKNSKRKVWKPIGKVFTKTGYTWRPTGRIFTILGNACPLTRITTTTEVPLRKPTALETDIPKPVVTLVYFKKPRKSKTNVLVSKPKIIKSKSANNNEPSKSLGSIVLDIPSSSLDKCRSSKLFSGTVKFGNDHVAKIMGYGDYQIGNVTILRVYYVEGVRHNLFSVGHLCDLNLEVAFRQHTYFIRNLEGVDLLNGSRDNGTELVNQTLRKYYEKVIISHETSGTHSPQQNGVVERQNRTLIEVARTITLEPVASTTSPSSTTVDQDAPSLSNSQTTPKTKSLVISNGVEKENHDLDVAHMNNDLFFGDEESPKTPNFSCDPLEESLHEDSTSQGSSSVMRKTHTPFESLGR
nr:integrase, catalytic region, zinc finger, CCHC-type, peptidase aspartic, catalytic [Tanacetum cinerariifolium]